MAPMRAATPLMNEHSDANRDLSRGRPPWRFALRTTRRRAVFGLRISETCCPCDASLDGDPRPCRAATSAAIRHTVPAFAPL